MGSAIFSIYLRATAHNASRVLAIVEVSVRPSVRLSITHLNPIKTVQAKVTKSSPWAAARL